MSGQAGGQCNLEFVGVVFVTASATTGWIEASLPQHSLVTWHGAGQPFNDWLPIPRAGSQVNRCVERSKFSTLQQQAVFETPRICELLQGPPMFDTSCPAGQPDRSRGRQGYPTKPEIQGFMSVEWPPAFQLGAASTPQKDSASILEVTAAGIASVA